ncbi:hypothetical protein ACWCOP_05865 [Maricaulaceae bacterium MS644]
MVSSLQDDSGRSSTPRGGLGRLSPPDWLFMPGAVLFAAGLIALAMALEPSGEDPVVTETEFVMAGPALAQLLPGPGTGFQLFTASGAPVARLTATASLEVAGRLSAGVAGVIPPEFEARVPGRLLKIEASLRAAPESAITEARLAYFTSGGGDSGWRYVPVGVDFRTVGFCYQVSPDAPLNEVEFVGVWPDIEGGARALLLRELRVTIQPEGATPDECQASFAG